MGARTHPKGLESVVPPQDCEAGATLLLAISLPLLYKTWGNVIYSFKFSALGSVNVNGEYVWGRERQRERDGGRRVQRSSAVLPEQHMISHTCEHLATCWDGPTQEAFFSPPGGAHSGTRSDAGKQGRGQCSWRY